VEVVGLADHVMMRRGWQGVALVWVYSSPCCRPQEKDWGWWVAGAAGVGPAFAGGWHLPSVGGSATAPHYDFAICTADDSNSL
jgi:hypothetical protein